LIRDASVIVLAQIDWTFNRQMTQEIACAFAGAGNRVLYVENTGVRNIALRDASRLWSRLRRWAHARGAAAHNREGVEILSPLLIPFPYNSAALTLNVRILLQQLRRWLRRRPEGPVIIVSFLPTPLVHSVVGRLAPDVLVYYCIDRVSASSPGAAALARWEEKMFVDADLVLVTSGELRAAAIPLASRVETIVAGVHVVSYDEARRSAHEPHPAFAGIEGPVIGFVGCIRSSTDIALLAEAARRAPELQFMLCGPVMTDVRELTALTNVHFTGAIPAEEVPRYHVRFEAGILPYVIDPFTAAIMPVKLKEYLAAGVPVVSTRLPDVLAFEQRHQGIVTFASDAASFVDALRVAVTNRGGHAAATRRIEVARQFDWSALMGRAMELIAERLETGPTSPSL
jgi:glycosyltransferase involved in cell wall biosynthesis